MQIAEIHRKFSRWRRLLSVKLQGLFPLVKSALVVSSPPKELLLKGAVSSHSWSRSQC